MGEQDTHDQDNLAILKEKSPVSVTISKLDANNLEPASLMADKVFSYVIKPPRPSVAFKASIDEDARKEYLESRQNLTYFEYFVATDPDGKVLGTVGLYAEKEDENDADWLGWFCVDPEMKGKGVGRKLLEYAITQAQNHGKKWLRLYTSTYLEETEAQVLYEKMGFMEVRERTPIDGSDNKFYIYREKEIQ